MMLMKVPIIYLASLSIFALLPQVMGQGEGEADIRKVGQMIGML